MDKLIDSIINGEQGNIEDYLTPEKIKEYGFSAYQVERLIRATGDVSKYLTQGVIEVSKMDSYRINNLLPEIKNLSEKKLIEIIKAAKADSFYIAMFIETTGDIERYLTPELVKETNINMTNIVRLISKSGKIDSYLNEQAIDAYELKPENIVELIKSTGKVTEYITPETIQKLGLGPKSVVELLKEVKEKEKFLTKELIVAAKLDANYILRLAEMDNSTLKNMTPELMLEIINISPNNASTITALIKQTGDVESYLTQEIIEASNMNSYNVNTLLPEVKDLSENKLIEIIKAVKADSYAIRMFIETTKDIEKYLTPELVKKTNMNMRYIVDLMSKNGKIETYLSEQAINDYGLKTENIVELIKLTGKVSEYITTENILSLGLGPKSIVELLKDIEGKEKFLTKEFIVAAKLDANYILRLAENDNSILKNMTPELMLEIVNISPNNASTITSLIKQTGDVARYLTPEIIEASKMNYYNINTLLPEMKDLSENKLIEIIKNVKADSYAVRMFIETIGDIEKYLTPNLVKEINLKNYVIVSLMKKSGNIEKYLNKQAVNDFGLESENVIELIKETEDVEKYITKDKQTEFGFKNAQMASLMNLTKNFKKYLAKEVIDEYGFVGSDVAKIIGVNDGNFINLIDQELKEGRYDSAKIMRVAEIMGDLQNSNSARLSRISVEIALQVYELPREEQKDVIDRVKKIYMTANLPEVAKDFLIFEQLHPEFVSDDKDSLYRDRSRGNIPSLDKMTPRERKRAIFSDLLRISIESNSRDLKEYISIIENGDRYFKELKEGKLKIDENLPEEKQETLKRYAGMLNALYNQTSKGKRQDKPRENKEDIRVDLEELESLFNEDSRIHLAMPDRIVRTFGYFAGIRSFEQAKQMIEEIPKKADERNRENAKNGKITLKKGDFIKGVQNTMYFPSMLQNGVIAKDYLGQSATSDATPLDMDVELIVYEGIDFKDTYKNLKTAPGYTSSSVDRRNLGKIILVFENDGSYIKTRDGREVNEESVEKVKQNGTRKEFFDNNGAGGENAHGIRTGVGSTDIKCIIADRYVDKLGLEIAINGFYIPVVNDFGEVIFTPEMYDDIRSKMQGLSHYGMTEFKLDESAKSVDISQIANLVDESIENASSKREMILKTLQKAIEETGQTMLTEREKDLLPGVVEVIDTGSTGRGTNDPGDGDFDFMVRLDSELLKDAEPFKKKLKEALSMLGTPESTDVTAKGDFRYKGVELEGLLEKVDIDLTFSRRTDEIEYTTEECIKDRLETIKTNNPEDYKYVVANILLAKKVLKLGGAYKKKSAPEPEKGQIDTRGGLGAVGIENWILQNGGSFEKAARSFIEVASECEKVEEFQERYAVWDFGENYIAGNNYPHDNFVYNMNQDGFNNMKKALNDYILAIDSKKSVSKDTTKKGIAELVAEDREAFNDSLYMKSVETLLEKSKKIAKPNTTKKTKDEIDV